MFITIINDCTDANVFGRQLTRAAVLFGKPVIAVGVANEIEAAGNLIDILDAADEKEGIILLNVAPRHGHAKKWPNGTPFAYFTIGKTIIVASIDGLSLSLVKKFQLVEQIHLMDIPIVLNSLEKQKIITKQQNDHIAHTQFRSYEFIPRVAKWLTEGVEIPSESYPLSSVPHAPQVVWYVDNFGNCKTTLLPEDIHFVHGKKVATVFGEFVCYNRLKDVPDHETALIIGSSGFKEKRFIEIVTQGKSAASELHITSGKRILSNAKKT